MHGGQHYFWKFAEGSGRLQLPEFHIIMTRPAGCWFGCDRFQQHSLTRRKPFGAVDRICWRKKGNIRSSDDNNRDNNLIHREGSAKGGKINKHAYIIPIAWTRWALRVFKVKEKRQKQVKWAYYHHVQRETHTRTHCSCNVVRTNLVVVTNTRPPSSENLLLLHIEINSNDS